MIIVLQNTETVETRLLFRSISMPRAVLLLGTILISLAAGIIASFFLGSNKVQDQVAFAEKKNSRNHQNTI